MLLKSIKNMKALINQNLILTKKKPKKSGKIKRKHQRAVTNAKQAARKKKQKRKHVN